MKNKYTFDKIIINLNYDLNEENFYKIKILKK
jgi:hypothetical protein